MQCVKPYFKVNILFPRLTEWKDLYVKLLFSYLPVLSVG